MRLGTDRAAEAKIGEKRREVYHLLVAEIEAHVEQTWAAYIYLRKRNYSIMV